MSTYAVDMRYGGFIMPSPIGHSIISLGFYPLLKGRLARIRIFLLILVFGNLPDIDFLPGLLIGSLNKYHQEYTHTLGFVLLVSLLVFIGCVILRIKKKLFFTSIAMILLCWHLLCDYFNMDTRPPIGIRVFWPFWNRHLSSPFPLFIPLDRSSFKNMISIQNLTLGLIELIISGAVSILIYKTTQKIYERK